MGLLPLLRLCGCARLPDVFTVEKRAPRLMWRMVEVGIKPDQRVLLFRCRLCGQHWQIDEWDKYEARCAIRVGDAARWQEFDDRPARVALLVESRGGLSDVTCAMARCGRQALKSLAYCPEHALEIGLRE